MIQKQENSRDVHSTGSGISARSVIIGLVLVIGFALAIQRIQLFTSWATASPFSNFLPSITGLLFVVLFMLINAIAKYVGAKFGLSRSELITVYILTWVGSVFAGTGYFGIMFAMINSRVHLLFARPVKDPFEWFGGVSHKLVPMDEVVIEDLAFGGVSVPWSAWFWPTVLWTLFALLVMGVSMCVASLFRRQWNEYEHLRFPLTIPVLAVIDSQERDRGQLLRNSLFYVGLLYPVILIGSNIVRRYFPFFPAIPGEILLSDYFPDEPWRTVVNYAPGLRISHSPLFIGIAYFIPLNIVFSLVFFFFADVALRLFWKVAGVLDKAGPVFPFFPRVGSWPAGTFMYGLIILYLNRQYVRDVIASAINKKHEDDGDEAMSYRGALVGLLLGFLALVVFSYVFLSIKVFYAVFYFMFTVISMFGFARLRAETGVPIHVAGDWTDMTVVKGLFTGERVGKWSGIGMAHYLAFHSHDGSLSSSVAIAAEAFKMCDEGKISKKNMVGLIMLTVAIAVVFSFISGLNLSYTKGWIEADPQLQSYGWSVFGVHHIGLWEFDGYRDPTPYQWFIYNVWHLVTAAVLPVLTFLHLRYAWWPLHPIGYIIGTDCTITFFIWFSFLVAGLIKWFVLRYGGTKTLQKLAPMFLAFIIGEVVMSGLQGILILIFGSGVV